MNMLIFACLVMFGFVTGGPAPPVTSLRIRECHCNSQQQPVCTYEQVGYAETVYKYFGGSRASCSTVAVSGWDRVVTGFTGTCTASSTSGTTFKVKTAFGSFCGTNYDSVTINNCNTGVPCSHFG